MSLKEYPYYEITLPLPPSVNAMHTQTNGFFDRAKKKWRRTVCRSAEYEDWIQRAAVKFRNEFPGGVGKLTGRLSAHYIFIWNVKDPGSISSDISNREKCLSDFLEHKFFENDRQIDEQHHYRRITEVGQSRAMCRIYAIEDNRYDDPDLIFNPQKGME